MVGDAGKKRSSLIGSPGGGMFPTLAALEGAQRMCTAIEAHFSIDGESFRPRLIHASVRYLDDLNSDHLRSAALRNKEAIGLRNKIRNFQNDLRGIDPGLGAAIEHCLDGWQVSRAAGTFARLDSTLSSIDKCLRSYRKESNRGTCVANLCEALVNIFQLSMRKPFGKTMTPKTSSISNVTEHFEAEGPEFVLILAQAMDPSIRFAQIRTALTKMRSVKE